MSCSQAVDRAGESPWFVQVLVLSLMAEELIGQEYGAGLCSCLGCPWWVCSSEVRLMQVSGPGAGDVLGGRVGDRA